MLVRVDVSEIVARVRGDEECVLGDDGGDDDAKGGGDDDERVNGY